MLSHVIFSGSHIWGFCYIGIIRYMQNYPEKFINVKYVGGVSFGSTIALLIALKIPIKEIEDMFYKYSNDNEMKMIEIDNVFNIIENKGMQDTKKYLKPVINYLKSNFDITDITFIEVSKKFGINLHVSALCVNDGEVVLFNVDNTPHVSVIDAVCASISVPIVSTPVSINKKLYCDPAIIENTLVEYFHDVPKNQILSVINKRSDTKLSNNVEQLSTLQYYMNLLHIVEQKRNYTVAWKYINDYTLIIENHDTFVKIEVNDTGINQIFDKASVDNCIIHGYYSISNWIKKHSM